MIVNDGTINTMIPRRNARWLRSGALAAELVQVEHPCANPGALASKTTTMINSRLISPRKVHQT